MPPLLFQHDLLIDGQVYKARRTGAGGAFAGSTEYVPQQADQQATVQLEPATNVTWHRGSGASRKMLPGMNAWGKNCWTCDPGYVTAGPLVTTVALPNNAASDITAPMVEQDGHLYLFGGRYAFRVPNGSGAPVLDQDLGLGFVASGARLFKASFFVGGDATGNLWEKPAGGAWTQVVSGGSGVQRGAMGAVVWSVGGVTREWLVASVPGTPGIAYVPSSNDPRKDTDWTPSPGSIAVGSYPITSMVGDRFHVYIATTGGLRDLDSSGLAPNLTPQVESLVLPTNGQATLSSDGWIYYGAGYGLLRVQVATGGQIAEIQDVTPKLGLPDESPIFGLPLAITRYSHWKILAQWDSGAGSGGTTYISWGRDSLGGYGQFAEKAYAGREIGPMVWNCSPIVLAGLKVTQLHVSGLVGGNPRLWMATVDALGNRNLAWAPLPIATPYQDLRQGRAYQFATSWDFYESQEDWGDDTLPKLMPDLVAETEVIGAGASVTVGALIDGNTSEQVIGTLNSNPRAVLTPSAPVVGSRIQMHYAATGQTNAPAILRKTSKRAIPRPDLREIRHYQLLIGRAVRHAGGSLDGTDPIQNKQHLARLQTGSQFTMRDEDGQTVTALMAAGVQFNEQEMDVGGRGERIVVASIACSILQTPAQGFVWGSGAIYGSGRAWT